MPLSRDELLEYSMHDFEAEKGSDVLETDCRNIVYLLENCKITIPEINRFFVEINCAHVQNYVSWQRTELYKDEILKSGLSAGAETLAYTGDYDFGHTTAEWESVISLGISGLRKRISEYAEKNKDDNKKQRFYREISKVYDAALLFLKRAADVADLCGKSEMAKGLFNLTENPPSNLFEAMQTTIIYYVLQTLFEGTYLRTLGRLDSLYYPYCKNEDESRLKALLTDFLKEIDRLKAPSNIPLALGGTDFSGKSSINKLSYLFLDAYAKVDINNTKFHLLCSKNTPDDIVMNALNCVRSGKNSIVFMSDEKIIESLERLGEKHEDAVNYHVVGCYECGGNNELTCSCNARVNIPMALELALNNGKTILSDKQIGPKNSGCFDTYDSLYAEFKKQLVHMCDCAMKITNLCESHYRYAHSAPILSGTYTSALEQGGDLYCDCTAGYNNSSVNGIGLATAADSLAAIKKLIYDDKTMTLDELVEILKSDWKNHEVLRLTIKNKFPKFGMDNDDTDKIAKDVADVLSDAVSGKPNAKGGVYRLGLLSIDWRWDFGKKTGASADGRHAGETLSQNTSASFGADKNGATAHLLSVAKIDTSKTPNGTIVDIDLHSSAVRGENGLKAFFSTLKTYFSLGGFAVHYNVLDTEVLKDAKLNPEKYPNLQVRLCGWNVLFSTLSEKEKDEFIERSMK